MHELTSIINFYIIYVVIFNTDAQDPIITIIETEPLSNKGVVMAIQNKDVTFNCYVENLPKDYKVNTLIIL